PGAWLRRLLAFLLTGLGALRPLLRLRTLAEGGAWGLGAWLLTSLAFMGLCMAMGLALPWQAALGIYPLAMLVGALSFVPGGVGTTEAAIVLMLRRFEVDLDQAVAAAIAIRLVTLWFAVLVGMLAMASLERSRALRPAS
ncbi:flippase-like domain-containing protein, partial [Xanthomonas sp. Kuri4-2]